MFIKRRMQYLLSVGKVTSDCLSKDDKASDPNRITFELLQVVLLSSYFLFLQQVNREIWHIVK